MEVNTDNFIKAYLDRINVTMVLPDTSMSSLTAIYRSHLRSFPYNNGLLVVESLKKPALRQAHSVELSDLINRLMFENRGGYCYETSELLFAALKKLDFRVKRAKAIVINCESDLGSEISLRRSTNPSTHNILIVSIDGCDWLLDPGFQPQSPTLPIMLPTEYGEVNISEHGNIQFKIEKLAEDHTYSGEIAMQCKYTWSDVWFYMYQFVNETILKSETIKLNKAIYFYERHIPIRDDFILLAGVNGDFDGQVSLKIYPHGKQIIYTEINHNGKYESVVDSYAAMDLIINKLKLDPYAEVKQLLGIGQ